VGADGVMGLSIRQRWFLRAFALWTIYVWATRIWNILGDSTRSTGFKVVHSVLAVISVAFAIGTLRITWGRRRD
jgi:hypothetical protein